MGKKRQISQYKNKKRVGIDFLQRYTMANKHTNRCSKLLVTKEMQINITIRYNFILSRTARIKKSDTIAVLVREWRNWNPQTPMQNVAAILNDMLTVPKMEHSVTL